MKAPIFKDVYYTGSTNDVLSYYIEVDGEPIFYGKAYRRPDQERISINVSEICKNYLSNDIPISGNTIEEFYDVNPLAYRTFILCDEYGTQLGTYQFLFTWDYDADYDFSEYIEMGRVINGHYTDGMLLMNTAWNISGAVWNCVTTDPAGISEEYYDTPACGDYALYYLNAAGGWDSFLIEGKVTKTDTLNSFKTERSHNNNTIEFGDLRYVNEITRQYKLSTNYLKDDEAERLANNLIPSTRVYLHNLITDKIIPVTITDSEAQHKFFNDEHSPIYYEITVEESQTKLRR